jgi:hypothetical protein
MRRLPGFLKRPPARALIRAQSLSSPNPGLRERIKTGQRFSGLPIAPARSFPQGATQTKLKRTGALRE